MQTQKFILHAPNIHHGGGATLLNQLLDDSPKKNLILIVDARMKLDTKISNSITIYRIKPSIFHRLLAERLLKKLSTTADLVLCFGNLPPLFKLKPKVFVFLQNIFLLNKFGSERLPFFVRLRLGIERCWFRLTKTHADKIIIQTPSMSQELEKSGVKSDKIIIAPLFIQKTLTPPYPEKNYNFIYVANGLAYKNHKNLLGAWIELAKKISYPSLCLTLNEVEYPTLCNWLKEIKNQYKLNITNFSNLSLAEIHALYAQSSALIFPSLIESFGLPLLEAKQYNLDIVASELDYVRDLVDPCQSFNPLSRFSIAHAVRRYLNQADKLKLLNSDDFFNLLASQK